MVVVAVVVVAAVQSEAFLFVCFVFNIVYLFFGSCVSLFLSDTPLIPFRLQCGGGGCSIVIIKRLAVILRFAD